MIAWNEKTKNLTQTVHFMHLPQILLNCSGAAKVKTDKPQTLQVQEGHRTIDLSGKLCNKTKVMPWTFNSNKDF